MGSIGGYAKGEHPFLDHFKKHNARINYAHEARAHSAPSWRIILWKFGFKQQLYQWCYRQPLDKFYPPEDWDWRSYKYPIEYRK